MHLDSSQQGHILYREFGRTLSPNHPSFKNPVAEFAKVRKAAIDSITLTIALREQYETAFDIYDHNRSDASLLALVEMHQKERILPYGRYDYLVRMYTLYEIGETFRLSLNEFLDLPRHRVEHLLSVSAERKLKRDKITAGVEAQLKQLQKDM